MVQTRAAVSVAACADFEIKRAVDSVILRPVDPGKMFGHCPRCGLQLMD